MKVRIFLSVIALAVAGWVPAAPAAKPTTIEMQVDGLVCAFCAQGIEKKLRKQAATADVFVSLEHKLVAVALKPEQDIADETIKSLLTEAGYTLRGVKRTDESLADIRKRVVTP
jgi:periplasmic mercuric ion binding protein